MYKLRQLSVMKFEPFFQYDKGVNSLFLIGYWPVFQKGKNCIKCNCYTYTKPLTNTFKLSSNYSHNNLIRHIQAKPNDNTCWNCHITLNNSSNKLFCDSCKSLQPIDPKADLFSILGIEISYSLNQSELKEKFRKLQTQLHPDKFSTKPKKEQELSEELSSIVNKAYSTLLDPMERGLYMLSLSNVSIKEGTTDMDKHFLMDIMERNEEIENEADPIKLNNYYKTNREQLEIRISKIAKAFENNDIESAKKLLTEMKYFNSIEHKIKELKQKLNIPD